MEEFAVRMPVKAGRQTDRQAGVIHLSGLCVGQDGDELIGSSDAINQVRSQIARYAGVDATVCLLGETGTGKNLVAALIHENSLRRAGPFVKVDCSAIPKDLWESDCMGSLKGSYTGATDKPGMFKTAHGGTLFIDELQDLSVEHQAKLRDFLDTKMIRAVGSIKYERLNVRIILGMNQNPQQMVQEGRFRADLFRRLGRNVIHVPPLRERKEDIPELARYAVRRICQKYELECKELKPEALILLREYDWPWNVGELQSVIENAVRSLLRYCRSGV